MIVVVEGPSAAGKSTWVARWPARLAVPETGRVAPPEAGDHDEVARFYADLNCARWSLAIAAERAAGIAICDSDPLKLHYDYCLARTGQGSWDRFWASAEASRSAIAGERLGIADVILCTVPDTVTLDRRRRADDARARRKFPLHRAFGPALGDWYRTLDGLDPGRVAWDFPDDLPEPATRPRFDLVLFDEWTRSLPGLPRPRR